MRSAAGAAALLGLNLAISPGLAGPAVNQFEVKGLSATPGEIEFQSQNAYSFGQPRRQIAPDGGDFLYDTNTVVKQRHALELEWTLSTRVRARVGVEFEKERVDDPASPDEADAFAALKFTEVAAESVIILVPTAQYGFGLGFLTEVGKPADRAETSELYFGPIVQVERGPVLLTANLLLAKFFGGRPDDDGNEPDDKYDFAYAAQAAYDYSDGLTLTIEAYGTIDRLGNTGRAPAADMTFGAADQHRIGPVIYYSFEVPSFSPGETAEASLGVGLLAGLTDATPDATLKVSLEIEY